MVIPKVFDVEDSADDRQKLKKEGWEPLSIWYLNKLVDIDNKLRAIVPHYEQDGCNNTWICKPAYNSKGFGIFLFNTYEQAKDLVSKKSMIPKVVQKYIENPLLMPRSIIQQTKIKQDDQLARQKNDKDGSKPSDYGEPCSATTQKISQGSGLG